MLNTFWAFSHLHCQNGKTIPWYLFKGSSPLETPPVIARGGMSTLLPLFPIAFTGRAEEKEQKRPGVCAFSPKLPQCPTLAFVGSGWARHKAAAPCSDKSLDTYNCSFFLPPLFSGCPTVRSRDILCSERLHVHREQRGFDCSETRVSYIQGGCR